MSVLGGSGPADSVSCTAGASSSIRGAPFRAVEFRASGNEPGWTLDILADRLVFVSHDGAERAITPRPAPQREPESGATMYVAVTEAHRLTPTSILRRLHERRAIRRGGRDPPRRPTVSWVRPSVHVFVGPPTCDQNPNCVSPEERDASEDLAVDRVAADRGVRHWRRRAGSPAQARSADVGLDAFSPVTDDYDPWDNAFTGKIEKITIDVK
jgi:hypothetical protein